ncbi:PKD domain-containing protein [Flaviaesturariibacter flavus]|uniref:PKD domain-containing protein n=1 Tax=Flaviaesturariibacter flavus TaxID=2502780 RepID=A0A4R1BKD0_9BACT|nr:PKD domain-containing protein [Flaviaesturariibacter flavus]TCJ17727.1 PKD domain-containing protein [Flaviaesturariibacter flavus]
MKLWFRLVMSIVLLGCLRSSAQNITNKGTDFWVGYGHHQFMEQGQDNSQEMVLYFAAEQAATVTVTIQGTTWTRTYSVPANSTIASTTIPKSGTFDARLISLPCTFVPPGTACGGEGKFSNKGIHITSDVPIVAYAHIYGSASSGATMLTPTDSWGYMYYSVNSEQSYAANCFSWLYVIAKENNTVVEITPTVVTRSQKPASVPFTVTLNKGEIYQVMAGPEAASAKNQMTGTRVKSIANSSGQCYPIAVFSGSSRTANIVSSCSGGGGDNDNQQLFPTTAWGKRYILAPLSQSGSASSKQTNSYKIVVTDPTTVVRRNGTPLTGLILNRYYQYTDTDQIPDYIESDKPVMIAQFMTGGSCVGSLGDPEMIILSPIEQGIKKINFYRNTKESISVNYLTLVIPTAGLTSLRIDNGAPDFTYPVTTAPGYSVAIKRWTASQSQSFAFSDSAFTAVTYGLGSVESYGYNAGTNLNNLNAISSIKNTLDTSNAQRNQFTCTNTPVELSALIAYQPLSLSWNLSALPSSVITPNTDVVQAPAVSTGTVVVDGITYYRYKLPGSYKFKQDGTFTIPIVTTSPTIDNCSASETLRIFVEVRKAPEVNFKWNSMTCTLDSLHLRSDTLKAPFQENRYFWNFLSGTDTIFRSDIDTLLSPGCYPIKLSAVSTEGCLGDTTKTVCVTGGPQTNIIANDSTICVGDSISFTSGSGGPGTWYWQFGSGSIQTYSNNNPRVVRFDTAGVYTIKHLFNAGGACQTDTARLQITVFAKPKPSFTVPDSCLAQGAPIAFTNTTSVADTQTVRTWAWNFADPSGGTITSAAQHPTYAYSNGGTYNVVLGATTFNGCFKDTTIAIQVKLKPVISFPAPAPVCQNAPTPVSVATATVTNGVTGTGVYSGPGVTSAGMLNPSVAGAGQHTIWYVFTTAAGCKDSASTQVTIAAKPQANFTWPGGSCRDTGLITFSNLSTVSGGGTMTYAWDFNDANATPPSNPNTSNVAEPTHDFRPGTYNVKLTTTAASGCIGDTTILVTIYVKPKAVFGPVTPVCENVTTPVSVANGSVTNGVNGTGRYGGAFTDAAGNFNAAQAGPGNHTVWFVFTSALGNCTDSVTQVVTVKPRPHPNFTVPGMGCMEDSNVLFTNTSSIIGNIPMTYSWNFGDVNATAANPNTSTAVNPTHIFRTATYTVQLSAAASNGCQGDTSITLSFTLKPLLTYGTLNAVCVNQSAPVSVALGQNTNNVPGTGVYRGPGTDAAGNFNPAAAGPGQHTIWYVYSTAGTCKDSVSQTILVYDRPHPNFTFPAGCLPVDGHIQFTNATTIGDGQSMTYGWDFNDPNAGAGNPNTSTAINPTHNYRNTGAYNIKLTATSANGCVADTTINTTLSVLPQLSYASLPAVCENAAPVSVAAASVLNNVTGNGTYGGGVAGLDAAGMFNPALAGPGTHTIKYYFTSTGNCVDSISQTIVVHPKPRPNFTFPNGTCMPDGSVTFTNTSTIFGGTAMTYAWDFGHPASGSANTSNQQNPTHVFDDATFAIKLTATSVDGCTADTTINATFSVKPALNYPALAAVCENVAGMVPVNTATVTNNLSGNGVYSGTATDAAGNFNPAVAGPGQHIITYTFTTASGCSTSVQSPIVVKPRPHPNFTFPAGGCLDTGRVQLTNVTPALGSNTFTWSWDFNDVGSDASNPNTSTLQDPVHTFGNGTFNIKLTANASNNCSADTTIAVTFSLKPKLAFATPAAVCASVPGTVSVAGASVTNGVGGQGVYSGTGVDALGNFNPSVAGAGTHNITYTFTSTAGCVKDTTVQIVVHPKPNALFSVTPDICIDKLATVTDASVVASGSITTWIWDLANGQTPTNTNGAPFTTGYSSAGVDTIKLTVVSDKGCYSDPYKKNLTVHPLPVVNFNAPASVCLPGGPAAFTSTSTVGDNSTLTYQWNFGDSSPLASGGSVTHVYADSNAYNVTLTATSAYGCVKDTMKVLSAFFNKPTANFSVNKAELCQGEVNEFTDLSTASGSTIVRRLWTFGNGDTDTTATPDIVYAKPGTYMVKLQVTNGVGCTADTTRQVVVHLQPKIDAGPSFVVPVGTAVRFNPTVNSSNLQFTWTPGQGLSNANMLRPTITANGNGIYYLTATGDGGCTATDSLTVLILHPVKIPNAFSPNGDGIHDTWAIDNLKDYPGATVEVFNRYGQKVFHSNGYSTPWDGRFNGSVLPFATYYYVITLKNGFAPITGSITIIR